MFLTSIKEIKWLIDKGVSIEKNCVFKTSLFQLKIRLEVSFWRATTPKDITEF